MVGADLPHSTLIVWLLHERGAGHVCLMVKLICMDFELAGSILRLNVVECALFNLKRENKLNSDFFSAQERTMHNISPPPEEYCTALELPLWKSFSMSNTLGTVFSYFYFLKVLPFYKS